MIADEFWVINWEGEPLFRFSSDTTHEPKVMAGFFKTIQSFAREVANRDDSEHINTISMGDYNFNFHNNTVYNLYFILKSSKSIKEKNIKLILRTAEQQFIEDYRNELVTAEKDLAKFEKFRYKIEKYFDKETLDKMDERIESNELSPKMQIIYPQKFFKEAALLTKLKMTMKIMPKAIGAMRHAKESYKSIEANPRYPRKIVNEEFIKELEDYAHSIGIGKIGYTRLSPENVYKGYSVLFPNVIVLALEMDEDLIAQAPSFATMEMIMGSYRDLNSMTNSLTDYLRENGYGAEAGPSLGGFANYVLLAKNAGLGWVGKLGLLITPEFGARQRLSIITTSIENLPFSKNNEHSWIQKICDNCRKCVIKCPGNAVLDKPITHHSGHTTHIDNTRCFPHFYKEHGCTMCIKECIFSASDYKNIKNSLS